MLQNNHLNNLSIYPTRARRSPWSLLYEGIFVSHSAKPPFCCFGNGNIGWSKSRETVSTSCYSVTPWLLWLKLEHKVDKRRHFVVLKFYLIIIMGCRVIGKTSKFYFSQKLIFNIYQSSVFIQSECCSQPLIWITAT